jgi:hypothetical protein
MHPGSTVTLLSMLLSSPTTQRHYQHLISPTTYPAKIHPVSRIPSSTNQHGIMKYVTFHTGHYGD